MWHFALQDMRKKDGRAYEEKACWILSMQVTWKKEFMLENTSD